MGVCQISAELVRVVSCGIIKFTGSNFSIQATSICMRVSIPWGKVYGIFIVENKIPVAAIRNRIDAAGRILRIVNALGYRRGVFNKSGTAVTWSMVETCANDIKDSYFVRGIESLERRPILVLDPISNVIRLYCSLLKRLIWPALLVFSQP